MLTEELDIVSFLFSTLFISDFSISASFQGARYERDSLGSFSGHATVSEFGVEHWNWVRHRSLRHRALLKALS